MWDEWNVAHIDRHNVLKGEVEEVCKGTYFVLDGYKDRLIIIGPTRFKRVLAIDPEPEEGIYYVVTARVADKKERKLYEKVKGGGKKDDKTV